MDEEIKQKYIEAGRIAAEAREKALEMAAPGVEMREIADETEAYIRAEGAAPAFPVNVSVDEVAAHFTPGITDSETLQDGQLVNIDVGVHVDGYIGDTAATTDLGSGLTDLQQASADAVDAALELVEPGRPVDDLAEAIQSTIEDAGYKPIRNLSGHNVERYTQHAGKTIPNVVTNTNDTLQQGEAIAIEPFATDGAGEVKDGKPGNIYRLQNDRARGRTARKVLKQVSDEFRTLPFASRWIDSIPAGRVDMTLAKLARGRNIHSYEVLKEAGGGMVSQTEHTVLVLDEPIVTTKLD